MLNHNSAQLRDETPHATNSIRNNPVSEALKRRAQSLINDRIIDAIERTWIRYALEINDPALAEMVRRADAGEPIIDDARPIGNYEEVSTEEKVERLAEMICRPGERPGIAAAALLVLASMLENSPQPRVLANQVKHIAFTRCGELNCYGMVDAQIAAIEGELLATSTL
jgi:hypothetical protein